MMMKFSPGKRLGQLFYFFVVNVFASNIWFLFFLCSLPVRVDVSWRLVITELLGSGPDLEKKRSDLIQKIGGNTDDQQ